MLTAFFNPQEGGSFFARSFCKRIQDLLKPAIMVERALLAATLLQGIFSTQPAMLLFLHKEGIKAFFGLQATLPVVAVVRQYLSSGNI